METAHETWWHPPRHPHLHRSEIIDRRGQCRMDTCHIDAPEAEVKGQSETREVAPPRSSGTSTRRKQEVTSEGSKYSTWCSSSALSRPLSRLLSPQPPPQSPPQPSVASSALSRPLSRLLSPQSPPQPSVVPLVASSALSRPLSRLLSPQSPPQHLSRLLSP